MPSETSIHPTERNLRGLWADFTIPSGWANPIQFAKSSTHSRSCSPTLAMCRLGHNFNSVPEIYGSHRLTVFLLTVALLPQVGFSSKYLGFVAVALNCN